MADLKNLRSAIDQIDSKLLRLLVERQLLATEITEGLGELF